MSEITIHDETEDSVAVRKGNMKIYVFHIDGEELRYNGPVNASEMGHTDVPDDVISEAESHTGFEVTGNTQEQIQRQEGI